MILDEAGEVIEDESGEALLDESEELGGESSGDGPGGYTLIERRRT